MLDIARFATINRPIEGYYFEFGSHEANTMRMAWDAFHHLYGWHFVAFDSFEGLPDISAIDRQAIWGKGRLKTAEESFLTICHRHGIARDRLTTVKGFYDDTLTPELKRSFQPKKAAVVYVDCDLYKSTVPVLDFIKDFLQPGTIIVFDDWNCFYGDPERGERRAWAEFLSANPELRFEPFVSTGMQMSFIHLGPSIEEEGAGA
ncbi:methyltransferase [Afifella sp. IM 167]|nr:methyltransferase [Afifella sp. IM 167]